MSKTVITIDVNDSDRSFNTIRYISKMDPFRRMGITLFHVFSKIPDGFWDLETDPRSTSTVKQVRAWEAGQRKNIEQYMKIAVQFLTKTGIPGHAIEVKIQNRKKGFARDIIREAHNGYNAVVSRRRGMTRLRGIVLGSVATKLVQKLTFVPLVLAGRKAPGHKILLGFDGSEGSWRAVDFVGRTMGGGKYKVKLIHVMRGKADNRPEVDRLYSPTGYIRSARKDIAAELASARKKLVELGFKGAQVSTELVTGASSRAGAIAAEARKNGYGTIVMGRRGHSRVPDFFIGRVTNKVIHMARDRTVWIVR